MSHYKKKKKKAEEKLIKEVIQESFPNLVEMNFWRERAHQVRSMVNDNKKRPTSKAIGVKFQSSRKRI